MPDEETVDSLALPLSERECLLLAIHQRADEIRHLHGLLVQAGAAAFPLPWMPGDKKRPGPRPKFKALAHELASLEAQLDVLDQWRAFLHAELVRRRGELVFAPGSGFDALRRLGIVAEPHMPAKKSKGRPSGRHADHAMVLFVEAYRARGRIGGRKPTIEQALGEFAAAVFTDWLALARASQRLVARKIGNRQPEPAPGSWVQAGLGPRDVTPGQEHYRQVVRRLRRSVAQKHNR